MASRVGMLDAISSTAAARADIVKSGFKCGMVSTEIWGRERNVYIRTGSGRSPSVKPYSKSGEEFELLIASFYRVKHSDASDSERRLAAVLVNKFLKPDSET